MEKLDAVLLEQILRLLPPHALAAAEIVCRQWAELISQRQLWRAQAAAGVQLSSSERTAAVGASVSPSAATVDWRQTCLQQAAAGKWRSGKLLLSATLPGHAAPVTCIATLQHIIVTGSSDCTAAVWDLQQGSQLHVLRHIGPVLAVALPSVSLCVTATTVSALLWRQGKAIRRFDVTPGGRVTSLALTDTQLLLGSSAGAVQHFDLFSGSQQIITRHGSSVTSLLAQQQQQQQGVAAAAGQEEDWHIIVGTADGQVSCMAASTGRALWQLATRFPSRVVALSMQQYQQQQQHLQHQPGKHRQHQERQQQQVQLLYVLNARSQLICWQVPAITNSSVNQALALQLPSCRQCTARLLSSATSRSKPSKAKQRNKAAGSKAQQAGASSDTTATAAAAASSQAAAAPAGAVISTAPVGTTCSSSSNAISVNSNMKPLAVCELPVQPATGLLASLTPHVAIGCSSLACPEIGSSCLFVGSSDGYLSVAELVHANNSSSSASQAGSDNEGGAGSNSSSSQELEDAVLPAQPQQQGAAVSVGVSAAVVKGPTASHVGLQEATVGGDIDGVSNQSSISGSQSCTLQLQVARRCPLGKLERLVGQAASKGAAASRNAAAGHGPGGKAAAAAVGARGPVGSSDHSTRASRCTDEAAGGVDIAAGAPALAKSETSQVATAVGVGCAVFTESGRLAVGLTSGHACLLRFRASK